VTTSAQGTYNIICHGFIACLNVTVLCFKLRVGGDRLCYGIRCIKVLLHGYINHSTKPYKYAIICITIYLRGFKHFIPRLYIYAYDQAFRLSARVV
jgi:hypothetical protein